MREPQVQQNESVWHHAPEDYDCPFCRNFATGDGKYPVEILHHYGDVAVIMNPRWRPANPGAVLVMPVEHFENVFDLPDSLGASLQRAVRETANAMKIALGCDGFSIRQNNESAGDQDVWHFHVHVLPRFYGDQFNSPEWPLAEPEKFHRLSSALRDTWPTNPLSR